MRSKKESEEEIVYKLIAPEKKTYEKSPRYTSKFRNKIKEDVKKAKCSHKTMGYASVLLPEPTGYLHKHEGIVPPRPEIEGPHCLSNEKKPQLPPRPMKLQKENLESQKNAKGNKNIVNDYCINKKDGSSAKSENYFRKKNIMRVIHSKPPLREAKIADTCRGDKHSLLPSGLTPLYLYKKEDRMKIPSFLSLLPCEHVSLSRYISPLPKDYGRLPKYIIQLHKETVKQTNLERKKQERRQSLMCIEGETRQKLLLGLKKNWSELQSAFQQLPMMIDTIPKIKKKLTLEKELAQLEKDIEIIEKHPVIVLCDDEEKLNSL